VGLSAGNDAPLVEKPADIFRKLFGGAQVGGSVEPGDSDLLAAARGEALELSRSRYQKLISRASGEDKAKLDEHLQFLSDYRNRFMNAKPVSCDEISASDASGVVPRTKEWARLVSHAMACGVTRVATMQLRMGPSDYGASGDLHQDHAHNDGKSAGIAAFRKYNAKNAEVFANIVNEFASRNLLDSTLLVWLSEHGVESDPHMLADMHALMVGNMNGYFKTGSHIRLPKNTNPRGLKGGSPQGVPHNHFLISLARGMGLNINRVGLERHGGVNLTGEIDEIKA
jgi:hypothetical protein